MCSNHHTVVSHVDTPTVNQTLSDLTALAEEDKIETGAVNL